MDDPHNRAGVASPEGAFWWLKGRAGRREYWAYVAALVVIGFSLRWVPPFAGLVESLLLAFVQARRLHDFSRSGWWAFAVAVAQVAIALTLYFLVGEEFAVLAATLFMLVVIVLIGAWPGDPGDNRFGPAPPFTAKRLMTGR